LAEVSYLEELKMEEEVSCLEVDHLVEEGTLEEDLVEAVSLEVVACLEELEDHL